MSITARIAEFWHLLKARLALMAGWRPRARASLKGALRRNPNSFVAHFLLGRLYGREGSVVKAKREFDLAWQIDPERFERVYARLRAEREGVPELFAYRAGEEVHAAYPGSSARRYIGDFVNEAERRRFETMPPITRDEIVQIDWDRFEDDLHADL